jgi:acyl-CoA reductase-like NAD-dependent aldehyde dehydrogenase
MARKLLLAGSWVEGAGKPMPAVNPADGSVIDDVGTASPAQVAEAVEAAWAAARHPAWRNALPAKRAELLHRVAELALKNAEHLARQQMVENGKTIGECREQARSAAGIVRYFAALAETLEEEVTPARGDYVSMTVYEPFGVIAAITPYNSPLTLGAQKLAGALAAGNGVVLKPSEITSIVSLELGRMFVEAGLPKGLVSVLPGGPDVGRAMVEHPKVGMVSFTGGTKTGRAIAELAAKRLIPALLELGGKSPNIVFEDADLELTVPGIPYSAFSSMGQSCTTGSRLFVQQSIHDDFLGRLVDHAARIRIGDPEDESAMVGPLSSFRDRERVESFVAAGVKEGGKIEAGGRRPQGEKYEKGAYYEPTIFTGLDNRATPCREEIFGPVLCVLPFRDERDLIEQANDTVYGLAAGMWTRDFNKAWRTARALDAGTVWINTYRQSSISCPFGGFKESGLLREKGPQGLRVYQQPKTIYIGLGPLPWHRDLARH